MIKLSRTILFIGVFSLGLISTANANLEARPGGMVYDTDLNITWMSDANYAKTSGYDADGLMSWSSAYNWAASLNVGGVSGWRLPVANNYCEAFYECEGGEMGHLFIDELGGTIGSSILSSSDQDLALFTNVQNQFYWTGWRVGGDYIDVAYAFDFSFGLQDSDWIETNSFAWAVHDGDVGLIPEPEMYAMLSIGLLAMFGFGRLSRQS